MATTPTWELALPEDGQIPWGDDYRSAMMEIDQRLFGMRGSMFVEDNTVETEIVTQGVFVPAMFDVVQEGPPCRFCDVNGDGRITYLGPLDRVPTVNCQFTLQSGPNRTLAISVRKNGDPVPGGKSRVRLGPNVSFQSAGIACNVPMSTNDFLEVFVANETGTQNLTVTDLTLSIRG